MSQNNAEAPAAREIKEDDIVQYERDGVVCLRGLIGPDWIARLCAATERRLKENAQSYAKDGETGRFAGDIFMWRQDPDFHAAAFESPLPAIARRLMRTTTLRFFGDQLFVKEPGTSSNTPWHHDQTYWPVVGDGVCSIWLALDPVTTATSGLEYVAGSHRWGRRFDPVDFGETSLDMLRNQENEKIPDIDANRGNYRILAWDMEPGDCLVHHSLAVHGSRGNRSASIRRRALATRWFGDSARFRPWGSFNEASTGLKAGEPMASPMFPVVENTPDSEF